MHPLLLSICLLAGMLLQDVPAVIPSHIDDGRDARMVK